MSDQELNQKFRCPQVGLQWWESPTRNWILCKCLMLWLEITLNQESNTKIVSLHLNLALCLRFANPNYDLLSELKCSPSKLVTHELHLIQNWIPLFSWLFNLRSDRVRGSWTMYFASVSDELGMKNKEAILDSRWLSLRLRNNIQRSLHMENRESCSVSWDQGVRIINFDNQRSDLHQCLNYQVRSV